MEAGVKGGSQNYAYVWNPALYMDSPNGPNKIFVPQSTVLYNLIVHDIACPNYTLGRAVNITVNQAPTPTLQLNTNYGCAPFKQHYDSKIPTNSAIITYDFGGLLQFQRDDWDYTLNAPGTYTLKVHTKDRLSGCGATWTYPDVIKVDPRPGSDFYMNPEVPTTADQIQFIPTNTYEPVVRYSWTFLGGVDLLDTNRLKFTKAGMDTSNLKTPLRSYNKAGGYPVLLVTENDLGCRDTIFKNIKVIDDMQVYIPNSFTPNGDGINDVFLVKGSGLKIENFSIQVVDRWGNIVFTTKDINEAWDGTVRGAPAMDGTYTVYLRAVGMNGEGRRDYSTYLNVIK
jgi:gliding motility-associated-like protein